MDAVPITKKLIAFGSKKIYLYALPADDWGCIMYHGH